MAVEIAGERLQTQTILGRLTHLGGKLSLYARTTARALLDFRLMFCHFEVGWWNVEYLPYLMPLRRIAGAALCLVMLMTAGCDSGAAAGGLDDGPVSATPSDAPDRGPDRGPERGEVVIGDPDASGPYESDPYRMAASGDGDGPVMDGDTLTITVSFSGGCASHDFTLITASAFMESDPVILDVFLTHDDHGDPCEAYPTERHAFDLTPIRALYQEAYGEDAGIVVLRIRDGDMNVLDEIIYEFGGNEVDGG